MDTRQGRTRSFSVQSFPFLTKSTQSAECWPEFTPQKQKYFDITLASFGFPISRKRLVEDSSTTKTLSERTPMRLPCIAFSILKNARTEYSMLAIWRLLGKICSHRSMTTLLWCWNWRKCRFLNPSTRKKPLKGKPANSSKRKRKILTKWLPTEQTVKIPMTISALTKWKCFSIGSMKTGSTFMSKFVQWTDWKDHSFHRKSKRWFTVTRVMRNRPPP